MTEKIFAISEIGIKFLNEGPYCLEDDFCILKNVNNLQYLATDIEYHFDVILASNNAEMFTMFRSRVEALTRALTEYDEKLEALQTECKSREDALKISKQQQDKIRENDLKRMSVSEHSSVKVLILI